MKVVIWIIVYIVGFLLNELLGMAVGIKLGYVLLPFLLGALSKAICSAVLGDEKKTSTQESAPAVMSGGDWKCFSCGTVNNASVQTCPGCGAIKQWSEVRSQEEAEKHAAAVQQTPSAPPAVDSEAAVPSAAPVLPKETSVLLVLHTGPMAGSKFRCREGRAVFIGRDPARCNLLLKGYTAVSGLHCRIEVKNGSLTVTDLNSTNGTFVNGIRLTPNQPAAVPIGGEIRLANRECIFQVEFDTCS